METAEKLKQIVREKYSEIADQSREQNIVLKGELPGGLRTSAGMYAGCVAGAIQKEQYLDLVTTAGFTAVKVQKERKITIPDEILSVYLSSAELQKYKSEELGIYSITFYGEKPLVEHETVACCAPGCCN